MNKLSKKILTLILALAMIVCTFGCGKADKSEANGVTETTGAETEVPKEEIEHLVPAEEAVSGGITQEAVEEFSEEKSTAVMTVNGEPFEGNVFQFATNILALKYAQSLMLTGAIKSGEKFDWNAKDPNFDGTYLDYVKRTSMNNLVPRVAAAAEGKRRGVALSDAEKQEIRDRVNSEKGNMSDEEFNKLMQQNGCKDVETYIAYQEFELNEQKLKADFEKNPEKYAAKDELLAADDRDLVTVKHILIAFNPENPRSEATDEMKANAKKKADEVIAKVNAGEDFDKLISEYSNDPDAPEAGYTFANDGTMVKEFTDAAFALEIGKTSGLVESSVGYHIIKRLDRAVTYEDYIALLSKNAQLVVNNSVFDSITVTADVDSFLEYIAQNMAG